MGRCQDGVSRYTKKRRRKRRGGDQWSGAISLVNSHKVHSITVRGAGSGSACTVGLVIQQQYIQLNIPHTWFQGMVSLQHMSMPMWLMHSPCTHSEPTIACTHRELTTACTHREPTAACTHHASTMNPSQHAPTMPFVSRMAACLGTIAHPTVVRPPPGPPRPGSVCSATAAHVLRCAVGWRQALPLHPGTHP